MYYKVIQRFKNYARKINRKYRIIFYIFSYKEHLLFIGMWVIIALRTFITNKKILLPSLATLAMAAGIVGNTTYALFTDKDEATINVTSGKVAVSAEFGEVELFSALDKTSYVSQDIERDSEDAPIVMLDEYGFEYYSEVRTNAFTCGGTVSFEDSMMNISHMVPGDKVYTTIGLENNSNVSIKARITVECPEATESKLDFFSRLDLKIGDYDLAHVKKYVSEWFTLDAGEDIDDLSVKVALPLTETVQDENTAVKVSIEAVQANAYTKDTGAYTEMYQKEIKEVEAGTSPDSLKDLHYEFGDGAVEATVYASRGNILVGEEDLKVGDTLKLKIENADAPATITLQGDETEAIGYEITLVHSENNEPVTATENDIYVKVHVGPHTVTRVLHTVEGVDTSIEFTQEGEYVTFVTKSFSPYTIVVNDVVPVVYNKTYGFYNSYVVDEGLETEHWVHEISNADEFRNILDSSVHANKTTRLDYPGAGEKETEYLLNSDIDFGGLCWNTPELLADVQANAFVGILDTVSGYPVTLSNIHVNAKTGSGYKGGSITASGIICLFDRVYDAKISNLVLDDMTLDDSSAKVGALLALGNETGNKEYLEITNVTTNSNCHVNINASAGGLVGLIRDFTDHATFKNCVNNASVSGSLTSGGTNIGGIISQSSQVGAKFFITFEDCINNGKISGGFNVGGLAGNLSEDGLIKNCINNGDITATSGTTGSTGPTLTYKVCGSFIGSYAVNTSLNNKNIYNIEMIDSLNRGKLAAGDESLTIVDFAYGPTYYEVGGVKVTTPTLDEFKSLFVSKYTNVNIVMSFNDQNKLVIEAPVGVTVAKYVLDIRFSTTYVSRSAGKSTAQTQANNLATIEILPEDLASFELVKINQIGYFAPDETCQAPEYVQSNPNVKTKQYALTYGFIDYSYHGDPALTPGYHSNDKGGYVVWDTTGTVGDVYLAPYIFGSEQMCTYNITALDADGKTVATGTLDGGVITSGIVTFGGTEWIPQ